MIFEKFWPAFVIVLATALLISYFTYDDEKMLSKLTKNESSTYGKNASQN
jgi:hypothetical protein